MTEQGHRPAFPEASVYLGLGSNLGDRERLLGDAVALLDRPPLCIVAASSIYETAPWGRTDQPRFLNQVAKAVTALPPSALLTRCREVESRLGRVRGERWGPRTIDVDILLYDGLHLSTPELTIPHPRLPDRAFVLAPLAELDPALPVPGQAATVDELLRRVPGREDVVVYRRSPSAPGAGAQIVGRDVRRYASVPSTNDVALRLLADGASEGIVVVAETQTAGRGRSGRTWWSPKGGLWLSVILRPELPPSGLALVTFAAGIAAARAIRRSTGLCALVKWPNDVLVRGAKVGGVLGQAAGAGSAVVIGIGLNANVPAGALPSVPGSPSGSLETLLGRPVDSEALLRGLLLALDLEYAVLRTEGPGAVVERWRRLAATLGRTVRVDGPGGVIAGTAEDIDETGALRVRTADGGVALVTAGDVRLRDEADGHGA